VPDLRVLVQRQRAAPFLAAVLQIGHYRIEVFGEAELAAVALVRRHRVDVGVEVKALLNAGLQCPAAIQHQLGERGLGGAVALFGDAQRQPLQQRVLLTHQLLQRHPLLMHQVLHTGQHEGPQVRWQHVLRHIARRVLQRRGQPAR